ncbi:MAG TPA: dephospho-CoA kinase [Saprospiraceae bacterium]|nr:dephospho-CoA kinase [Saprospiraceae bacterium]
MRVIGLTGGIGSGKSSVAAIFTILGVPVYDSDRRARFLMEHDQILISKIKEHFGPESYLEDGTLNRKYIAWRIFQHDEDRIRINALVHPAVGEDFHRWLDMQNTEMVIKESALLLETLGHQPVDKIIVVAAPEALRIQRVARRDHLPESDIRKRISSQTPESKWLEKADYMIYNSGEESLIRQTLEIYKKLQINGI